MSDETGKKIANALDKLANEIQGVALAIFIGLVFHGCLVGI